jgi:cyclopropane-fatty-acyl-phospholipid synthase
MKALSWRHVAERPPGRTAPPAARATPASFAVETRTGARWTVGAGHPEFVIRTADLAGWRALLGSGPYDAAKAFVDGQFDVEGDLIAALRWWYASRRHAVWPRVSRIAARVNPESWVQTKRRARRNIEFHYDRSNEFYEQFLDRRLEYSAAYFTDASQSLDEAQLAKLDYALRKLDVQPGERLLDIGCGWGALVLYAAAQRGARATGCTLSRQQFEYATKSLRDAGLTDRATIELRDYRLLRGSFDKIASIGMYEHVGRHRLQEYFATLANLMPRDALLLNSGIARPESSVDDEGSTFLRRFVFPGGEIPYLTDIIPAAERAGLEVLDIENLRYHYAATCERWVSRLQERRERCLSIVDPKTYRTWLLYLAGSVISFERGESELFHILFAKRHDGAPHRLTRDYMYA